MLRSERQCLGRESQAASFAVTASTPDLAEASLDFSLHTPPHPPQKCFRTCLREAQDEWRLSHIYYSFSMAGRRSHLFEGGNKSICTLKAKVISCRLEPLYALTCLCSTGSEIIRREYGFSFLSSFSLHSSPSTCSMQMENFEMIHRGYTCAGESLHISNIVLIKMQKLA